MQKTTWDGYIDKTFPKLTSDLECDVLVVGGGCAGLTASIYGARAGLSVLVIEVLQLVFLTGSADIDDFILNVGGAMAAYGILNIDKVKRGINKILFGEINEN